MTSLATPLPLQSAAVWLRPIGQLSITSYAVTTPGLIPLTAVRPPLPYSLYPAVSSTPPPRVPSWVTYLSPATPPPLMPLRLIFSPPRPVPPIYFLHFSQLVARAWWWIRVRMWELGLQTLAPNLKCREQTPPLLVAGRFIYQLPRLSINTLTMITAWFSEVLAVLGMLELLVLPILALPPKSLVFIKRRHQREMLKMTLLLLVLLLFSKTMEPSVSAPPPQHGSLTHHQPQHLNLP